jgi:hypothetical protein
LNQNTVALAKNTLFLMQIPLPWSQTPLLWNGTLSLCGKNVKKTIFPKINLSGLKPAGSNRLARPFFGHARSKN